MIIFKKKKKVKYKDLINKWLKMKREFVKESTYANYRSIVYNHLIPELGDYYLKELSNELLQNFIIDKYHEGKKNDFGGLSHKMVKDITSVIKSTIKYGMKIKMIEFINLEFDYPNENNDHKIRILDKQEQMMLINYVKNVRTTKSVGLALALYTGLRIGELCALEWRDIDFKRGYLMVTKTIQRIYIKDEKGNGGETKLIITEPKTKNATRIVPLSREFLYFLRKMRKDEDIYILSGKKIPMEPGGFRRYYYRVLDKLDMRKVNFHTLRHTFASNCIRIGCDYKTVSELLGHSSVNITLNIYVHAQYSQKKKCINSLYRELTIEELENHGE